MENDGGGRTELSWIGACVARCLMPHWEKKGQRKLFENCKKKCKDKSPTVVNQWRSEGNHRHYRCHYHATNSARWTVTCNSSHNKISKFVKPIPHYFYCSAILCRISDVRRGPKVWGSQRKVA